MLPRKVSPSSNTARTCRGERPDKKRHPQSWNSTDVMEGPLMDTQPNNTTVNSIFNTYRHQIILDHALKVESGLCMRQFNYPNSQVPPTRREEIRAGSHRMRDHGCTMPPFNRIVKGAIHERESTGNHVGADRPCGKSAGVDPASYFGRKYGAAKMPVWVRSVLHERN